MYKVILLVVLITVTVVGCQRWQNSSPPNQSTNSSAGRPFPSAGSNPILGSQPPMPTPIDRQTVDDYRVENYATGLVIPWDMAFVSADRVYVTERPGRVRLILNGNLQSRPYATIDVLDRGEGGLMGIALHPNYPNPRWVYLMYTTRNDNRISRFTDTGNGLTDERTVVTGIPSANVHNGGIIRFGPDGMLYAGTGDAAEPENAQNLSSLAGKILRMTPEGGVPSDNPISDSLVYAYGFRNIQGLAWNPENNDLWATNHGPTGDLNLQAKDSVYIVRRGGNHGWPRVLGVTDVRDVVDPILYYPDRAVPPALATFYNADLMPELKGNFFFTTLKTEHLQRVILSGPRNISRIERWWPGRYGRLRSVVQGPDGALYVSTSNRDGRGRVRSGDDKILRISPR